MTGSGPLARLPLLVDARSMRVSSYDRSGGNDDRLTSRWVAATLAHIHGPARITHIWMTIAADDPQILRRLVLRAWWDDEGGTERRGSRRRLLRNGSRDN
ncbi:MAG: hypothetical protein R2849_19360 [Thermomicrobiales bacterium]